MAGTVRRRQLLGLAGTVTTGVIAGCLDEHGIGNGERNDGFEDGNRTDDPDGAEGGNRTDGPDESSEGITDEQLLSVEGNDESRDAVTRDQLASVGEPRWSERGGYHVELKLTEEATESLLAALEAVDAFDGDPTETKVVTHLDGETTKRHRLSPALVETLRSEEYDGRLVATFQTEENATVFHERLQSHISIN